MKVRFFFYLPLEAQIPISLGFAFDILRIGGDVYDCFRLAVFREACIRKEGFGVIVGRLKLHLPV